MALRVRQQCANAQARTTQFVAVAVVVVVGVLVKAVVVGVVLVGGVRAPAQYPRPSALRVRLQCAHAYARPTAVWRQQCAPYSDIAVLVAVGAVLPPPYMLDEFLGAPPDSTNIDDMKYT